MSDTSKTPSTLHKTSKSRSPLTHGTWVLVADGEKALLLENIGDADLPVLQLRRADAQDNPPTHEQGTDRPGRMSDGPSGHRSAVEDSDWHRLAKDRFAHDLAEMLYARAQAHRFERLIVAAAPKVLGELRKTLHKEVSGRIVAELPLDLTNHPVDDMARRIADAATPGAFE
jgi:protein required for attachment to host cells